MNMALKAELQATIINPLTPADWSLKSSAQAETALFYLLQYGNPRRLPAP
jgi:hypothetical protein